PGIELVPLPENGRCCGAAGSYMISQPEMAQALLDDKLEHLKRLAPSILVTSNVGCALHFQAGIRAAGLEIEVLHPVTLIARQMTDNA
ncbi:MAG: heterodisulfide reductase-related iron-sulfur binding cluster, partial [Gammaproteobacteria bacterium]